MNTPDKVPASETYDATQTAILDATIACVMQFGFGGVTTRRIAEAAAVNEVTIFRRFGNKAEVLKAAFRREASFVRAEAVYYSGHLEADLQRIVDALWHAADRRRSILPMILAEMPRNPELREAAQQSLQVIAQITSIIQQYQEAGQLRPESPMMTFAALIGPIMFITLMNQITARTDEIFRPQDYVRQFLSGRGLNNSPD